jgi:hypothetical protein
MTRNPLAAGAAAGCETGDTTVLVDEEENLGPEEKTWLLLLNRLSPLGLVVPPLFDYGGCAAIPHLTLATLVTGGVILASNAWKTYYGLSDNPKNNDDDLLEVKLGSMLGLLILVSSGWLAALAFPHAEYAFENHPECALKVFLPAFVCAVIVWTVIGLMLLYALVQWILGVLRGRRAELVV